MTKLLSKLALLAALVLLLEVTLVPLLHKRKDVRRFEATLAAKPDVIYFCDSTDGWIDAGDTDVRSISRMLDDRLSDGSVGSVNRGAYHAEVYEAFVDLIVARELRPRAIVVPINLRSFSPEWDLKPAYQFTASKREIRHADDRLYLALVPVMRLVGLLEDSPIDQGQYKSSPVYRGTVLAGHVRDFDNPFYREVTPERIRNKMIFHYMYPLQEDHRKLQALRRISEKAQAAGLTVLFYLSPIDVQTGESHLPGEFRAHVEGNLTAIHATLDAHEPPLIDLAFALDAEAFSWHEYPNEHMRQAGRRLVAERLAEALAASGGFELE